MVIQLPQGQSEILMVPWPLGRIFWLNWLLYGWQQLPLTRTIVGLRKDHGGLRQPPPSAPTKPHDRLAVAY